MNRRVELEQAANELRGRAANDLAALNELCEVCWKLGDQDAAMTAFIDLMKRTGQVEQHPFDAVYLRALRTTRSCPVPLRRRFRIMELVKILDSTSSVQGLVVECGCYFGLSSYMLCSYLQQRNPAFDGSGYHIFDSFQGLSEPTEDDDIPASWQDAERLRTMTKRGHFAAPLDVVRNNLEAFPEITYHPGWIPQSFNGLAESRYRFVHVDVDLYDPTLDALNYFYPRVSAGGVIVSDDYSWPGAQTAIKEFCGDHRVTLAVNSVGQAIVRKQAD